MPVDLISMEYRGSGSSTLERAQIFVVGTLGSQHACIAPLEPWLVKLSSSLSVLAVRRLDGRACEPVGTAALAQVHRAVIAAASAGNVTAVSHALQALGVTSATACLGHLSPAAFASDAVELPGTGMTLSASLREGRRYEGEVLLLYPGSLLWRELRLIMREASASKRRRLALLRPFSPWAWAKPKPRGGVEIVKPSTLAAAAAATALEAEQCAGQGDRQSDTAANSSTDASLQDHDGSRL